MIEVVKGSFWKNWNELWVIYKYTNKVCHMSLQKPKRKHPMPLSREGVAALIYTRVCFSLYLLIWLKVLWWAINLPVTCKWYRGRQLHLDQAIPMCTLFSWFVTNDMPYLRVFSELFLIVLVYFYALLYVDSSIT